MKQAKHRGVWPCPVYGWNSVEMYKNLTIPQLTELGDAVRSDPKSINPGHTNGSSIYLYVPAARRKLDAIAWAITYHLQDKKAESS